MILTSVDQLKKGMVLKVYDGMEEFKIPRYEIIISVIPDENRYYSIWYDRESKKPRDPTYDYLTKDKYARLPSNHKEKNKIMRMLMTDDIVRGLVG